METQLINYAKAGYPGVYIISSEEARVENVISKMMKKLKKHNLYAWSATSGIVQMDNGTILTDTNDPYSALTYLNQLPDNSIILLRDFHLYLLDPDPTIIRLVKDALFKGKAKGLQLIILGCRQELPPELEKEFIVVDFILPEKEELGHVLDELAKSAKIEVNGNRDAVLDSAMGLTTNEAENAFALSLVETKDFDPEIIAREKSATIKKNGLLKVIEDPNSLDDVGGLELLKHWLTQRRDAFSKKAIAYHLPSPKGILIAGIPGTGKSLTAKATARALGRPLIHFDAGKVFAGLVGQSEANMRSVIQTAEAIAPCVLWIDEIEKGFSGTKSSNSTDGGTSNRVFGSFLSWMQDKTAPVFIVATANDITQLPPEFLRKGRFDEIFFCDLPTEKEREEIWKIQIKKHHRNHGDFKISNLVDATAGFTGAEIEQAFIEAMYSAFAKKKEPSMTEVSAAIMGTSPLSKMMAAQVQELQEWAKNRARSASISETKTKTKGGRKISA